MEILLANSDNLRMILLGAHLCQLHLGRWKKASYPKNIGDNKVLTNNSLPSLCLAFIHVLMDLFPSYVKQFFTMSKNLAVLHILSYIW